MKLQFTKQQFQEDATNAVCDVFEGQPRQTFILYTKDLQVKDGIVHLPI